jgi:hypothetical protein
MIRNRNIGARLAFSNEKFLELLSSITGISPVGVLGRETPLDLSSLEAARGSLLLGELFSKYDDGLPSPEKERVTWEKFHAAESSCRESNEWIRKTMKYDPFWRAVRLRITDTLGTFSWDECSKHFGFGPGATTRLPRSESFAAYKYSGIPESTLGNAVLASCAIRMNPLWKHGVQSSAEEPDNLVKVVQGNRVITVPKNYKTDRTIAKEPCMNIYIQKGIGKVIRFRLKSVGIDLRDQTLNQQAARKGSIDGSLATVDLSMASDTISFELVSYLLPNDWWWALEQSRSPVGVLPSGTVMPYQKFSSMGNGYTFELETLIFWAIAQQVTCSNVNETDASVLVYGDDIVIPSAKCAELKRRLRQAGFTTNEKKTFDSGPYRESCGKHYYLGNDVTPFYVRSPVAKLDRLFLVHNNLYRWFERTGLEDRSVLTTLRNLAPASWRKPRLPDGFGDGAFIGSVDELQLDSHPYGWECWQAKVLSRTSMEIGSDLPDGQLIASLNQLAADRSDATLRKLGFIEFISGLPVREGRIREINISIQRYPLA